MKNIPSCIVFPGVVVSGPGSIAQLPAQCGRFGRRGMLIRGRAMRTRNLPELFNKGGADFSVLDFEHPGGEPTLEHVRNGLAVAREHGAQWVAGVGGGSVIDLAKTVAGLFLEAEDPAVFHDGAAIRSGGIPFLAAPTTAGTGAEATLNAVLINSATGSKKSIRSDTFMARAVILDPALLAGTPPRVIAYSGMDAFTQALEAFVSRNATRLSDALCMQAMELIAGNIEPFFRDSAAASAAAAMLEGSFLAGLALSMARLGLVHGLAHPLGAIFNQPHGLVCAVCLGPVLKFNRPHIAEKYDIIGRVLGADPLDYIAGLMETLKLASPFRSLPLSDMQRDAIIKETLASGSTKANPRTVSAQDASALLDELFGA